MMAAGLAAASVVVVIAAAGIVVVAARLAAAVAVVRSVSANSDASPVSAGVADDLGAAGLASNIAARTGAAFVVDFLDKVVGLDHSRGLAALVTVGVDVQIRVCHAIGTAGVALILVRNGQRGRQGDRGAVGRRGRSGRCSILVSDDSCGRCLWSAKGLLDRACRGDTGNSQSNKNRIDE
ncbi:hypothetical protein H4R99_007448 [Coemansia sp. RSA 1722]|nr:hypothetical protein H4R99_007448 [Coemansia sp. RSA 1722]